MKSPSEKHLILLVEDDPNDVELLRRAVRRAKITNPLRVVRDGDEAVEYLAGVHPYGDPEQHPAPELVLLDLKLPRRSGHEVLDWIRNEAGITDLPVVVLTASKEHADLERAYALGANSYLVKPATLESLRQMLETAGVYWLALNVRPESAGSGTAS